MAVLANVSGMSWSCTGSIIGVVFGLVPAIAISLETSKAAAVAPPWTQLALTALGIPLFIAAGRDPDATLRDFWGGRRHDAPMGTWRGTAFDGCRGRLWRSGIAVVPG